MIQDFGTATTTESAGANNIIIGTLEKLLGNGCLLLFGTFAILTDYCRNFLSRWASHWLTRELNKVTLKWPWGPRDSDSRATMWLLWVKKTTVSTNWHQFEPIFGWLREEGAEALKFTSLASSDSAWFWLSTIDVRGWPNSNFLQLAFNPSTLVVWHCISGQLVASIKRNW